MKRWINKAVVWGFTFMCIAVGGVLLHYLRRIFIADQFIIPTESMLPSLIPGDRVMVNKLIMGARIYRSFDFSGKAGKLHSFRMYGLRGIEHNDLLVFNFPWHNGKIAFRINYVYAKRCVGLPGDSVTISHGFLYNNRYEGVLGDYGQQLRLSQTPDEDLAENVIHAFPFDHKRFGWTIKDMGPLYIPREGDVIGLDEKNVKLYRQLIEYESEEEVRYQKGKIRIGNTETECYQFKENYYFMCGDYALNSRDSRYCGFVPESYIVGVISHITYSKDNNGQIRWDRVGKCVLKDDGKWN